MSESFKFNSLTLSIVLIIILEILLVFLLGLELYNAFVVGLIFIIGILVFIDPASSLFLIILSTHLFEGKLIEQFVLFRFLGFNWYVMDLIIFIILLVLGFYFSHYKIQFKFTSLTFWLLIFFVSCIIGVFIGIQKGNDTQSIFYDLRGFFYYISFLPTIFFIRKTSTIRYLFYFLMFVGSIKASIDIYFSLFVYPRYFDTVTFSYLPFSRLTGYSEIIYPLTLVGALAFILYNRTVKNNLILIPTVLLSSMAVILSLTRGSWFSVIITVVVALISLIFLKQIKLNYYLILFTTLPLIIISFILHLLNLIPTEQLLGRVLSVSINSIDISNLGRLTEYATALEAFISSPITGAGLGFHFVYFSPGIGHLDTIYCHNSYLYILSKLGLIGIIPFTVILFSSLKIFYKVLQHEHFNHKEKAIMFAFGAMFFFIIIKSFTTWHLNTVTFSLFIGLLFGLAVFYQVKLKQTIN